MESKLTKLNIGCGRTILEGYLNCDIVGFTGVDIVSPADNIPLADNTIDEILTEHLIEHLTFEEFNRAIVEWHRLLKPGGSIVIECPDLFGICQAFVEANEYSRYSSFKGYWPLIAHFYGHQRGSTPEEKRGQIHKSGYTSGHLIFILHGVGFTDCTQELPQKANPFSPTIRIRAIKE